MRTLAHVRRNAVAYLALFVALGGTTAYATHAPDLTTTEDILDGEVKNQDLGDDSVSSSKLQTQAVTTGDLAPNSVTDTRIPTAAVGSSEIKQGDVFNADLAANSITDTRIAADAVGSSELKPDAVGSPEVANNSLSQDDIAGFRQTGNLIVPNNGQAISVPIDTLGPLTVNAVCERNDPNLKGSVTIGGNSGGLTWAVHSNAENGADNQAGLSGNSVRNLISMGPTSALPRIKGGDFVMRIPAGSNNTITGLVGMDLAGATSCFYMYSRFGGP